MTRLKPILAALVLILALAVSAKPAPAKTTTVILLTTSDIQGQMEPFTSGQDNLGGMARLAAAIKAVKAEHPGRTLALATGDDLMGRYFLQFHGRAMYEAMNSAGFDVATLGNHEFDLGPEALAEGLPVRNFPLVVANLTAPEGSPLNGAFYSRIMTLAGGVKIGFFGLITPDLASLAPAGASVTVETDLTAVAQREVAKLQAQGADLIVALTHIGLDQDRQLAAAVDGIDVIVGGHSHDLIATGEEVIVTQPGGGKTIIVQTGDRGTHLGRLEIYLDGDRLAGYSRTPTPLSGRTTDHSWRVTPMDASVGEDPATAAIVAHYKNQLPPSRTIATSLVDLDVRKLTVRTGEAAIGNLVTDIMRRRFGTNVAAINGGNLRGDRIIPAGPITTADIDTLLPFGNEVDLLQLKGSVLIEALEHGLSGLSEAAGRFLQVSGLKFTARSGQVVSAQVGDDSSGWSELDPDAVYSLATNAYMADGGDGFTMLRDEVESKSETFVSLNSLVQTELESMGEISPRVEGRITLED